MLIRYSELSIGIISLFPFVQYFNLLKCCLESNHGSEFQRYKNTYDEGHLSYCCFPFAQFPSLPTSNSWVLPALLYLLILFNGVITLLTPPICTWPCSLDFHKVSDYEVTFNNVRVESGYFLLGFAFIFSLMFWREISYFLCSNSGCQDGRVPFLEGVCVRIGTDRTTGTGEESHSCVKEIYPLIILKITVVIITDHLLLCARPMSWVPFQTKKTCVW